MTDIYGGFISPYVKIRVLGNIGNEKIRRILTGVLSDDNDEWDIKEFVSPPRHMVCHDGSK